MFSRSTISACENAQHKVATILWPTIIENKSHLMLTLQTKRTIQVDDALEEARKSSSAVSSSSEVSSQRLTNLDRKSKN